MAEQDQQTSEQLAEVLKDLALKIERLKQLYEQYFMGIERMEPLVARKEATRTILQLQQGYIRNTALRYKFNTMLQKWSSYTTYWNRTLREIENGTYIRHVQKAARAAAEKGRALPSEMRVRGALPDETPDPQQRPTPILTPPGMPTRPGAPLVTPPTGTPARAGAPTTTPPAGAPAARPPLPAAAKPAGPPPIPGATRTPPPPIPGAARPATAPPIPPAARPAAPPVPAAATAKNQTPASGVPGMSENELRALHKKYSEARAAAGDKAPVRYESLVATLAKQAPKVLEQPGVRGVRFDVSVRDGKPVLKAIPTK